MVIVVNVRAWKKQLDGIEAYVKRLVLRLVTEQPEHRFYLVCDEPLDLEVSLPPNVSFFVLGPAGKQQLLQKYWLDVRLPWWLRKVKADVLVNLDGMASLTTKVAQCLLVPDGRFLPQANTPAKTQGSFYRSLPRFFKKANRVVLPSASLQTEAETHYKLEAGKTVSLAYAVPNWFYPVDYDVKESIKASFAQGHEYFLYKGLIHDDYNLVNLLKAFSFFKKRQQSSWKLILAGPFKEGNNEFQKRLMTYKYKEDVVVTGVLGATEEREMVAAAYALISPAVIETVDPAIWEAMQCQVPVIAATTTTNKAVFGESVIFFDGNEPTDLAEWIMHLYRHEGERKVFIERGQQLVSGLSWEQATASLWQCVVQAANA